MKSFFSIGELSCYQNISRQTLIFYDKIGLFSPARVDPDNGYRYYSSAQLDTLDTILLLKKIGFSLKEIRSFMKDYTTDRSIAALGRQLQVLAERIEELKMIQNRVEHRCTQLGRQAITPCGVAAHARNQPAHDHAERSAQTVAVLDGFVDGALHRARRA